MNTDPGIHQARYFGANNEIRVTNNFSMNDHGIVMIVDKFNATLIPWQRIIDITTLRNNLL